MEEESTGSNLSTALVIALVLFAVLASAYWLYQNSQNKEIPTGQNITQTIATTKLAPVATLELLGKPKICNSTIYFAYTHNNYTINNKTYRNATIVVAHLSMRLNLTDGCSVYFINRVNETYITIEEN